MTHPEIAAMSADQQSELSRLRASMGFIPKTAARPRLIDGRYKIVRRLGSGGMGVVYLAEDTRLDLEQDGPSALVAVKLVRGGVLRDYPGAARALRREAQQMARLRNDAHVVTVHDVCEGDDPAYFTMEYIEGQDLRRWCRAAERERDAILRVYRDAARGLAAAHRIGLVHRDFKPENVIVDERGDLVTAKVTDFGIADLLGTSELRSSTEPKPPEAGTGPELTDEHAETRLLTIGWGTMAYVAPERLAGERADARSDQFSFCVALWEALADQLPYRWRGREAQVRALVGEPAELRALARARGGRKLVAALRKGMALERDERHPTMAPIIAVLDEVLDLPRQRRQAQIIGGWIAAAAVTGWVTALAVGGFELDKGSTTASLCEPFVESVDAYWSPEDRAALAARGRELGVDMSRNIAELDRLSGRWSEAARDTCRRFAAYDETAPELRCLNRWLVAVSQTVELLTEYGDARTLADARKLIDALAPEGASFCSSAEFIPADRELVERVEGARVAALAGQLERADELSRAALDRARAVTEGRAYAAELAEAHAIRAEALSRGGQLDAAYAELAVAETHALAIGDTRGLARIRSEWAWILAHERKDAAIEASEHQLGLAEAAMHALDEPEGSLARLRLVETRALLDRRQARFEASIAGYEAAAEGYRLLDKPGYVARAMVGQANVEQERRRFDVATERLQGALKVLNEAGYVPGHGELPLAEDAALSAIYDLAVNRYEEVERRAGPVYEQLVDESLAALTLVSSQAKAPLDLTALVAACQISAENDRIEPLRSFVGEARATLADREGSVDAVQFRAQIELAAMISLHDPEAEAAIRKMRIDPSIEVELRGGIVMTWLSYLQGEQRCAEWRGELATASADLQLMANDEFVAWYGEHSGSNCN